MEKKHYFYLRIVAPTCPTDVDFWNTNVIGKLLRDTAYNQVEHSLAACLLQDAVDADEYVKIALPESAEYDALRGWYLMVELSKRGLPDGSSPDTSLLYDGMPLITTTEFGDSGDCVIYDGKKHYYEAVYLPRALAKFVRFDECGTHLEAPETKLEGPTLYVRVTSDSVRHREFWYANAVARALCATTARLGGLTREQAVDIMSGNLNTSRETAWKLADCYPYTGVFCDGHNHVTLNIVGESLTELRYGTTVLMSSRGCSDDGDYVEMDGNKCLATAVNVPYVLACAVSRENGEKKDIANPGDALLERMNDEVMTEERAESVRRLQEELCPPVPEKTIGEHIPDEPAAVPKYVQMVHHEEPVVHPPVPKKPVETKQEPATPGKTDGGFAGKLYRAAAMAVVKFGEGGCLTTCEKEIFSLTNSQLMRELMPLVMSACDSYLAGNEAGQGAIRLPGQPGWVFLGITDDSVKISLVPVEVVEQI